jgi:hypothetical protein
MHGCVVLRAGVHEPNVLVARMRDRGAGRAVFVLVRGT